MNLRVEARSLSSIVLLVFAALGLLGLLAACGGDEAKPTATPTTAAGPAAVAAEATPTPTQASDIAAGVRATPTPTPLGERPMYGGVINFIGCCSGFVPRGQDPYDFAAPANLNAINYSSLISLVFPYDPSKGVVYEGHLAKEWTPRDDGTWLLKLREGVTWHDGEAFTADDVVATFKRFIDPEVEVGSRTTEFKLVFTDAEKVDDYTVIVHTGGTPNTLAFTFLSYADLPIVPSHLISGDLTSDDWKKRWLFMDQETGRVGTGPFKESFWDPETEWISERYENYFLFDEHGQRLPYLDAFHMVSTPDGTRRLARFASGAADYTIGRGAGLHPDRAKELCEGTRDKECYIMEFPHGYFNTITNPGSTEQFKDARVNAASRYAQDMDEIANLAYGGRQGYMVMDRGRFPDSALTKEEQHELIPWSVPERRDEFVQKAKDLLAEAGYPDGFKMPLPYFSGGLCSGSFLDQYSRQVDALVNVGIQGFLECREGVVVADELKAGRFSINAPGSDTRVINPADGLIKFHLLDSSMVSGPWRYEGQQEVDDMFRVAQRELDFNKRMTMYLDIERFIADPKWTVYPNMHTVVYVSIHGCVRNFHPGGTWRSHGWSHWRTWLEPDSECIKSNSAYLESQGYR